MPNREQTKLARTLGIDVARDTESIAAARLLDAVAEAVGLPPFEPSTARQQDFAASLGENVNGESKRVASAIIDRALFERNQARLIELKLKPGDHVIRIDRLDCAGIVSEVEREFIVSSIHSSGRIYFKGGKGEGAWPTQVRKLKSDGEVSTDTSQTSAYQQK